MHALVNMGKVCLQNLGKLIADASPVFRLWGTFKKFLKKKTFENVLENLYKI